MHSNQPIRNHQHQQFTNDKIQLHHRQRTACIYLRQSTMFQVMHNQESTLRQYALQQKAADYGWDNTLIRVLDGDLGRSGSSTNGRDDFKQLVAEVSMGNVGAIFVLEASRLSRSSADWNRLLELCALTATLIIDQDGCYNPASFNDQLLLGLKGTMSQAELHLIRARLYGAKLNKAQKGELRFPLPVGYVHDEDGNICFDPDEQVCHVIRLVFDLFKEKQSIYAVVRYFGTNNILFPKRSYGGRWKGKLVWDRLNYGRACAILSHPFYAGVYTFGRNKSCKSINAEGEIVVQTKRQAMSEWPVFIKDHHLAYITYEVFEQNRQRCLLNRSNKVSIPIPSAVREGATLVQGILYCSDCGRRLTIRYAGKDGHRVPTYECNWRKREGLTGNSCLSFRADSVDPLVEKAVLSVLTPAHLDIAINALEQVEKRNASLNRQWEMNLQRQQYQADLAQRRFEQVDPANRLVAASLEKTWNFELEKLAETKREYDLQVQQQQKSFSAARKEEIRSLADRIPELWSATTNHKDKKRIIRLLISDIIVSKVGPKLLLLKLRWQTGQVQEFQAQLPLNLSDKLRYPDPVVQQVRELTVAHGDDRVTVEALNEQQVFSATGKPFTEDMIQWIRFKHNIPLPLVRSENELTVSEVAARFAISTHMVYYYVTAGVLSGRKTRKCLLIRVSPGDDAAFRQALANAPKAAPRSPVKKNLLCV